MNRAQQLVGLGIVLALALTLGYAGFRMLSPSQSICQVCGRMSHRDMRTVAYVGGHRELFCCPTCALSAGKQTQKEVRFDQLSDYPTGKPLRPGAAFAVEGSDIVPCVRAEPAINSDGQPIAMEFDRCRPSILAFGGREAAERFAVEHGGKVAPFTQLIEQLTGAATR